MEQLSGSKRRHEDEEEERSSDGSDDGSDLEDFIVKEDSKTPSSIEEDEDDDVLPVVEVTGTVVGGRVLRDRTALKPVERYFDTETYKRLMELDEARDMLVLLRKWSASGDYTSPVVLTKKSPLETIRAEYKKAKAALELPDTDDEEEEEEEEDTSDETAEEEEESSSEDVSSSEEESEEDLMHSMSRFCGSNTIAPVPLQCPTADKLTVFCTTDFQNVLIS
jgi:hypothetical protein